MAKLHEDFEWDPAKAEANQAKHGVSFHDAAFVLSDAEGDRFHLEIVDDRVKSEIRYVTYATDPEYRSILYVICWTPRKHTRIISARFAEASEKRFYEKNHHPEI